jgi:hypothetical protein
MKMPMASGIAEKNGGTPEGARQENNVSNPKKASSVYVMPSPDKLAAEWLDQLIAKAKAEGKKIMVDTDLTPARARILLNRNPNNRKVSPNLVASFARDMTTGAWDDNGESIIISEDGELNDGQQRCLAVVESGVTVPMVFTIGVKRASRLTVDRGRSRSGADFLAMEGHENAVQLNIAASFLWQYQKFGLLARGSNKVPTKAEILKIVDDNKDLDTSVEFCKFKKINLVGGNGLLAFAHYVFWKASNRAKADEFIRALATGEGHFDPGDPINYARTRLSFERGKLRGNLRADLIFKAWNAHRRGQSLRKLVLTGASLPTLEK